MFLSNELRERTNDPNSYQFSFTHTHTHKKSNLKHQRASDDALFSYLRVSLSGPICLETLLKTSEM